VCLQSLIHGGPILSWVCGHSIHMDCLGNRIPRNCYVCRAALSALDVERVNDAMPGALREQRQVEEHDDVAVPRDAVFLCCPRVGPPPDFVSLDDRRMVWSQLSRSWACRSCNREVLASDIQHLCELPPPYCVAHDANMCMVVDDAGNTQSYACGYGERSDVPSLRSGCSIGIPQVDLTGIPQVDLTEEPDRESWQGELAELQGIVNGHRFSEELAELYSLVRRHMDE